MYDDPDQLSSEIELIAELLTEYNAARDICVLKAEGVNIC